MLVHCTKRKKENRQRNQQIQLKFDHTAYQFFFVVSKRRKFRLGKMYKILGITQSKLRTYGNGNHFNYLGAGIFISKNCQPPPLPESNGRPLSS